MKNTSKENYLRTIFRFCNEEGKIKTAQIAEKLGISNAAVTDMMKKLSREGYVKYERYKDIKLTKLGESFAKNIVRRHRIWELFLNRIVKLSWDKVHDEAENLEHSSSDELIDRMEEMLGFPEFDPHGDPIPDKNGTLPEERKMIPLSNVEAGKTVEVIKVNDFDSNFLNYLSGIGIALNKKINVKDILTFDNSMLISVDENEINISDVIATNIFVIGEN